MCSVWIWRKAEAKSTLAEDNHVDIERLILLSVIDLLNMEGTEASKIV